MHTLSEGGVGDGFRLGVLVLSMVLLGVNLFVLLEVLRPLEGLFADVADVRLERCVHCQGPV